MKPVTVFLYKNPSVSNDEIDSLEILHSLLTPSAEQFYDIFFASNHLDLDDFNSTEDEEAELASKIATEHQKRYDLLRSSLRKKGMEFSRFPDSVWDCNFFGTIGARDALRKKSGAKPIISQFVKSLVSFLTLTHLKRLQTVVAVLTTSTKQFFNDTNVLHATKEDTIVQETNIVKDLIIAFERKSLESHNQVFRALPSILIDKIEKFGPLVVSATGDLRLKYCEDKRYYLLRRMYCIINFLVASMAGLLLFKMS